MCDGGLIMIKQHGRHGVRKKGNAVLPEKLKGTLWSYDISKIDIERDKKIIIENVLNHGTDDEILWVLRVYSKEDIVSVLKNPSRGSWDRKSLNFWLFLFNVKIEREKYERALREVFVRAGSH